MGKIWEREQKRRQLAARAQADRIERMDDTYLFRRLKLSGDLFDPENQAKIKAKRIQLRDWRHRTPIIAEARHKVWLAKEQHHKLKTLIKQHHDNKH